MKKTILFIDNISFISHMCSLVCRKIHYFIILYRKYIKAAISREEKYCTQGKEKRFESEKSEIEMRKLGGIERGSDRLDRSKLSD